jgi:AraC-like DNA-binding protein
MSSLTGQLAPLPDVVGRSGTALVDRLRLARDFASRVRIVCRWIEESRLRWRGPASHVALVAHVLERSCGVAGIEGLRRLAGVTPKRLAADFRSQVGVTPKFLARLLRFRNASAMLQGGGGLADVALSAGYYDQSHFGLDFRELAGITPREFLASVYPDGTTAVA